MRRHINLASDIPEVSATEELQKTFALLLPIRRQRLSRSERVQREQERALKTAEQQIVTAQQQLEESQHIYQELRNSFTFDRKKSGQLNQTIDNERRAGEEVQGKQSQLTQSQQNKTQQQQRLTEAQQETRMRQRDLEKLEYLIRESEGLQ